MTKKELTNIIKETLKENSPMTLKTSNFTNISKEVLEHSKIAYNNIKEVISNQGQGYVKLDKELLNEAASQIIWLTSYIDSLFIEIKRLKKWENY